MAGMNGDRYCVHLIFEQAQSFLCVSQPQAFHLRKSAWNLRNAKYYEAIKKMNQYPFLSLSSVAVLMIAFGIAEIITAFTHNFLGLISTADVPLATYAAAAIGGLYAAGGLLLLTMKKWAARLAILSLIGVIAGRISIVLAGLYPAASFL
jgi:hypothetical protein